MRHCLEVIASYELGDIFRKLSVRKCVACSYHIAFTLFPILLRIVEFAYCSFIVDSIIVNGHRRDFNEVQAFDGFVPQQTHIVFIPYRKSHEVGREIVVLDRMFCVEIFSTDPPVFWNI